MVHTVIKGLMVLYILFCISNLFLNSSMETKTKSHKSNTSSFFFFFLAGWLICEVRRILDLLKIYKDRKQTISCAIIFCFKEIGESQHVKAF